MKTVPNFEVGTPEWHALRKQYITASWAGPLLGVSPWADAADAYAYMTTDKTDDIDSEAADWGAELEQPIVQKWARDEGHELVPASEIKNKLYVHDNGIMATNLDALIVDDPECVVEVKMASKSWDEIPLTYQAQGMHQLAVTGRQRVRFVVLHHGNSCVEYVLERDEETIANLEEVELRFWNENILGQVPPPATRNESVKKLYPAAVFTQSPVTADVVVTIGELRGLKKQRDEIDKEIEQREATVKQAIGNAEEAVFQGRTVATWKNSTRNNFDTKEFKVVHPVIYSKFIKPVNVRTLRLTKEK